MSTQNDFTNTIAKLQAAGIDHVAEPGVGGMRVKVGALPGGYIGEVFNQHGAFLRYEYVDLTVAAEVLAPA